MNSKKIGRVTFTVGDKVTVLHAVECYYSNYGGNPELWFNPGDHAVITYIVPKVRISGEAPTHDKRDEMIIADTSDGQRVSINFCNAVKLDK